MQLFENATEQKLRGGYYTPPQIAAFLLQWGMSGLLRPNILEPSCGDGVFIEQMQNLNMDFTSFLGVELDAEEANKALSIGLHDTDIQNRDFHEFCLTTNQRFDLVIGNPPFIRYQYYDESLQSLAAKIFQKAHLRYSKLTNAWVTFIIGSTLLLKNRGKIAFVVPADILQVTYAKQLRNFLINTFNQVNIISFEQLVFDDIQQEVVLLLCEKNGSDSHSIDHIDVKDISALQSLLDEGLHFNAKTVNKDSDKWSYYFLTEEEISFIENLSTKNNSHIGDYASVEVGITTGANQYFTVPKAIVDFYRLDDFAKPMVGRSVQVPSLDFTTKDWLKNVNKGSRAHLLVFKSKEEIANHAGAKEYIASGEADGINKGYKTSIRDDWFVIPSIKLSDALFLRRNHLFPRLVLNSAQAYTTDTMHRVFFKPDTNHKAFVASYYNSFSFAHAEIVGRNFGGGVLELMPSEVESIFLSYDEDNAVIFDEIDAMLRKGESIDTILDFTDRKILIEKYGYSIEEVKLGRNIWKKLSSRRLKKGRANA
ncbi:MAG: class I SAM-dependent methyltransferase [Tannerella sp.]|uniref:class I SAM-dependent methyltransferase n=1 Tax=Coprobacter fastidiosus TaxID=1099853 RepID=UPI00262FDD7B|nr:class I SAM-dependent methyltransferase [Coprobacter fastidiosus]MBS6268119.1 class I SAM-dependent methyltransferase [Tannerella sp.]